MLKSNRIYNRTRKNLTILGLTLVAVLSSISSVVTFGVAIRNCFKADNVTFEKFAKTQDYQNELEKDYNIIIDNAIIDNRESVKQKLNYLDSKNYKRKKFFKSDNEILLEEYNNYNNSTRNANIASGILMGIALASGGAAASLDYKNSNYKKSKEEENESQEA